MTAEYAAGNAFGGANGATFFAAAAKDTNIFDNFFTIFLPVRLNFYTFCIIISVLYEKSELTSAHSQAAHAQTFRPQTGAPPFCKFITGRLDYESL